MPDIVIPESVFGEFLKSLFVNVTREQEGLVAEMLADVAMFRARLEVARERKMREVEEEAERKLREVEEAIARRAGALEDKLERKIRAAEEQIEIKLREAEEEIARLRQLERLRQTAAAKRSELPQ
jgi:hypothetical protein